MPKIKNSFYLNIIAPVIYEQKFITKDNFNNLLDSSCEIYINNFHSMKTTKNSKNKVNIKFDLKKEK